MLHAILVIDMQVAMRALVLLALLALPSAIAAAADAPSLQLPAFKLSDLQAC